MKSMKTIVYILLLLLTGIFSCKKEEINTNYSSGMPDNYCDHHVSNYGATIPIGSSDL